MVHAQPQWVFASKPPVAIGGLVLRPRLGSSPSSAPSIRLGSSRSPAGRASASSGRAPEANVRVRRARLQEVRRAHEAPRDRHRARERDAVPREDRRSALTFPSARRAGGRPPGRAPFCAERRWPATRNVPQAPPGTGAGIEPTESRATARRGEPVRGHVQARDIGHSGASRATGATARRAVRCPVDARG